MGGQIVEELRVREAALSVAQGVCHAEIALSVAVRMQRVGSTGCVVVLGSRFCNRWRKKWLSRFFLLGDCMGLWEGGLCDRYGVDKMVVECWQHWLRGSPW